ncbi:MAG: hypothetical protein ACD_48C00479G0001 [uncultured bacterium]|nr:MAG: hypothetical protein ACD_48C00479G0001 [uncultured bacterium]
MKSKKKFPFKIVDETDSTFKVTFHERLPQIHFNKNERWAHLCFFIIDRGLLQMSPSATDDEIFEYWKMQDKAYSFKDSPYKIESDKLRIAIQQAVETTNKNIIKAFPTMVGKTVFEKQDGGVYLRPTSKK